MHQELIDEIAQKFYSTTICLLDFDLDGLLFNIELESNGLLKCLKRVMIENHVENLTNEEFLCIKNKLISKFKIKSNRVMDEWEEKYYDDRLEYKKVADWFEINFQQSLIVDVDKIKKEEIKDEQNNS